MSLWKAWYLYQASLIDHDHIPPVQFLPDRTHGDAEGLSVAPCLPMMFPVSSGWTSMAKLAPSSATYVLMITNSGWSTNVQMKIAISKYVRLMFAIMFQVEVIGHNTAPEWPKLGPALLIATALVVAIRTARWAATAPDAGLSDIDPALDKEIGFGVRVADRVLHALLRKHPGLFPQRKEPIYAPGDEDVQP